MSKPLNIFIIRHGESEGNVDKSIYNTKPDYAVDLTPLGRKQANEAADKINKLIDYGRVYYYVSPMWRARRTYEIFSYGKIHSLREDPRLREQDYTDRRYNQELIEQEAWRYGPFYYRLPGGESGADVYERVSGFLDTLHRDFEKKNYPNHVIIVTHGMTMRLLLMRWFHYSVEEFHSWRNPFNCEFFHLKLNRSNKYDLINPPFRMRESILSPVYEPYGIKNV